MENQYTFTDCDKQYCHKNAAHGMSEFRCKECSSVFGYETALKRHVRRKRFVCSMCRNTFTYRANYVRHLKTKQKYQYNTKQLHVLYRLPHRPQHY